jgi:hypothetical protein
MTRAAGQITRHWKNYRKRLRRKPSPIWWDRQAGSTQYLKSYIQTGDIDKIDLDLIVRAAARIERLAKIRYGVFSVLSLAHVRHWGASCRTRWNGHEDGRNL